MRTDIAVAKRWVVHVDSRLISTPQGLNLEAIAALGAQLTALQSRGIETVVVSAGATAAALGRLQFSSLPAPLHETQALAAMGQIQLINAWDCALRAGGVDVAQVLLTHDDLSHRKHYLNARSTLQVLLSRGVIPIVSENGAIASHGIRSGDTDTLGALIVNLVQADAYVMLTEVGGLSLFVGESNEQLIDESSVADSKLDRYAHDMTEHYGLDVRSWLRSARLAARSGAHTLIADGQMNDILNRISVGEHVGTLLVSDSNPEISRAQWLSGHLPPRGTLELIAGSVADLAKSEGVSALMILRVEGVFQRGDIVVCTGPDGTELARGLANYSAQEIQRVRGLFVEAFPKHIGYVAEPEVISHENLVVYPRH